jgi:hemoglobin-like flavoprotein
MSDVELVRASWMKVMEKFSFDQVGDLFYDTLFKANPSLPTTIFQGIDTKRQGVRLIQMIDGAIKILDRPNELVPVLIKLGERHAGYGTESAHFAPVGEALIGTLAAGLGAAFTQETAAAWGRIYGVIEKYMTEGMNNEEGQRQRKCGPYAARHLEMKKAQVKTGHTDEDLVRESWAWIMEKFGYEEFGLLFYNTLFQMDPSLPGTLFKDVRGSAQAIQLIQMIDGAVKMLDRPVALAPVLIALGERHAGYGTTPEHMRIGGECLQICLKKGLGDRLTPEYATAWAKIYDVINVCMGVGMSNDKGRELYRRYLEKEGKTAVAAPVATPQNSADAAISVEGKLLLAVSAGLIFGIAAAKILFGR